MQLANSIRYLMVAILFTLTSVSFAQAQAWLERAECAPFIAINPEHPETMAYLTRFVTGSGASARINVDAFIASVNPAEKARACGFAQPGSNESYARVLRTHNVGLESAMSFNDFAGWMNQHNWRITYFPLSATDVAAWDQAAAPRMAASAPAVARQPVPAPQGLTQAQVRRMIEAAIPAAPTELTDDQLTQIVSLLELNFAGFGEGMSLRLTEILAGYASQEEVAAFGDRLETVVGGLAQFSDRLTAVGDTAAAAQATADEALNAAIIVAEGVADNTVRLEDLGFRTTDLERVVGDVGRGLETLAADAAADRATNAARFDGMDDRLGALDNQLADGLTTFGFSLKQAGIALAAALLLVVIGVFLIFRSQAQSATAQADEAKKIADAAAARADKAKEAADAAVAAVANANDRFTAVERRTDSLTDRVGVVEETVGLLLERDAQGRFRCPQLSPERVATMPVGDPPLVLSVPTGGTKTRLAVHVTVRNGGNGRPELHFFGLQSGHDFCGTVTLAGLYKHLAKAADSGWVIGVKAARGQASSVPDEASSLAPTL